MAVYASLEHLNIKDACIRCQIDSAIPEKRGMGSSAAISIAAIRAVVQDLSVFSPDLLNQILPNRHHTMRTANELAITQKELMVLHYLNRGLRNADIADKIYVSVSSVKTYIHCLLKKLGVDSRLKLVARARELGLLED